MKLQTPIVLVVLLAASVLLAGCSVSNSVLPSNTGQLKTLKIANHTLQIEIASTETQRAQGLSDRDKLPADHGMLFVFPAEGTYQFWMKDMKFSLDFIWINQNKVVGITPDVQPPAPSTTDNELPLYQASQPVNQVLEVDGGYAAQNSINIGDSVELTD